MKLIRCPVRLLASLWILAVAGPVQPAAGQAGETAVVYVELQDEPSAPVAARERERRGKAAGRQAGQNRAAMIDAAHAALRPALERLGGRERGRFHTLANAIRLEIPAGRLAEVAALPGVASVRRARSYEMATTTSVPHLGAPAVWDRVGGPADGTGVRVGIIDSGIDYTHADFGGPGNIAAYATNNSVVVEPGTFPTARVAGGFDFAGDDYNASDALHTTPVPDPDPLDAQGHGTAVAGIVAGGGVLSSGAAYSGPYSSGLDQVSFSIGPGMAPRASIYALKVFGRAGTSQLVGEALEWAADPNGDLDFSDRLDVVNLSLGSSFGTSLEEDFEVDLISNLAQLGCVVVCSAGNGGNTFYSVGSPGSASRAIAVANLNDFTGAIRVTSPPAAAGYYGAVAAAFGPGLGQTGPVEGSLVYAQPNGACASLLNPAALAGQIALLDRGDCNFQDKVWRVEQAGARAAVVVNNVAGAPITMGAAGSNPVTIPSVMISQADGALVKSNLAAGLVVRLDGSLLNPGDPVADTVADSSARGPAGPSGRLKPEICAPGDGVFTASRGGGAQGAVFSGTSSSSPHVAGAAALLRQIHPGWPAEDIKAALMNTAVLLPLANGAHSPESRTGAGRAQVDRAAAVTVTAAAEGADGGVALSFGALDPSTPATYTRWILLTNHGPDACEFAVAVSNTISQAGVAVAALASRVSVSGLGWARVGVQLAAAPGLFDRVVDPGTPLVVSNRSRSALFEASGQVWFLHETAPLHVPYHAAVRAAAQQKAAFTNAALAAEDGWVVVPVGGWSTHPAPLVSAFQLGYATNSQHLASPVRAAADVVAAGAACNAAGAAGVAGSLVFFGIATASPWTTPQPANVSLQVEVDTNLDGAADYTVYHTSQGNVAGGNLTSAALANDVLVTAVLRAADGAILPGTNLNFYPPSERDTAPFNTSVLVAPAPASSLGLSAARTRFAYRVSGRGSRSISDAVARQTPWILFDAAQPGLNTAMGLGGLPFFNDGGAVTAAVHRASFAAYPQQAAMLLLHHQNGLSGRAEIVRWTPPLSLALSGGEAVLNWMGAQVCVVEQAGSLAPGARWTAVAVAAPPYRIPATNAAGKFFRLAAP